MDWLKKLLEEQGLNTDQVKIITEGVEANYKGYVPKHRFDEVNEAKKQAETALADRDKQLVELKKAAEGNEELKKQIETLQTENKAAKEKFEAEATELRTNTALKLALANDVHDPDLLLGLLDKSKIELDDSGNIKAGLEDQVKALRESKGFLFKEAPKGPQFKGILPRDGSDGANGPTPEHAQFIARLDAARKAGNNLEAIAIKREAAAAGVTLI